jgi:hypothetical protein
MITNLFPHGCVPLCRDGEHAALVYCNSTEDDEEYPPRQMVLMYCEHGGAELVYMAEAHEVPELPPDTLACSLNIETWEWASSPLHPDSRPYLVIWRALDGGHLAP